MNITTMRNGRYSVEIRKTIDNYSLFKFIIDRSGDIVMVDELHCLSWDDAHSRALDYINHDGQIL